MKLVTVNGKRIRTGKASVTYEEIVEHEGSPVGPNYSMTYKGPTAEGCLAPGQRLELEDGMVINFIVTGNA